MEQDKGTGMNNDKAKKMINKRVQPNIIKIENHELKRNRSGMKFGLEKYYMLKKRQIFKEREKKNKGGGEERKVWRHTLMDIDLEAER